MAMKNQAVKKLKKQISALKRKEKAARNEARAALKKLKKMANAFKKKVKKAMKKTGKRRSRRRR